MRKGVLLVLTLVVGMIACFVILFFYSLKNSKDCYQFVIDTYEIASGIDIPALYDADCFFLSEEKIRVGIYEINTAKVGLDGYINKSQLQRISAEEASRLWTFDYLSENNITRPNDQSQLYFREGNNKRSNWQCILDKNTGRLWFEIEWLE